MNMVVLTDPAIQRLAWSLVHFLWQGFLIALVLVFVVRWGRVQKMSRRYICSLVAMTTMLVAPVATFVLGMPAGRATAPQVGSSNLSGDANGQISSHAQSDLAAGLRTISTPETAMASPATAATLAPEQPGTRLLTAANSPPAAKAKTTTSILSLNRSSQRGWLVILRWIVPIWISGVVILSLRLLVGWLGLLRLRQRTDRAPEWLELRLDEVAGRMRVTRPILKVGRRVTEAIAMGFVKPMILLPTAWITDLPPDMLEAVLVHEMAHIHRNDLWINLFQRVVETLLFYHPAVWWLSNRLRREREMCCDELVVRLTEDPLRYAETLEQIGRLSLVVSSPMLAVPAAGSRSILVDRVRNVLRLQPREQSSWVCLAATIPLILAALVYSSSMATRSAQILADDKPREVKPEVSRPAQSATRSIDDKIELTLNGRVLDAEGKPVAGADVMMYQSTGGDAEAPIKVLATKSDAEGVFRLKGPRDVFQQANVWSVVPWEQKWVGPGLGWGVHPAHTHDVPTYDDGTPRKNVAEDSPDRFVIRLNNKLGRIRVEDPQVAPVTGAKVTVAAVTAEPPAPSVEKRLSERRLGERFVDQIGYSDWIVVPAEFRRFLTGVTNKEGLVELEGIYPDRIADLQVETEGYGLQMVPHDAVTRASQALYRFRLSEVGRIEGRLSPSPRATAGGFRPEGLKLVFRTTKPAALRSRPHNETETSPHPDGWATATVDADGRFVVPKIADGYVQIENPFPDGATVLLKPATTIRVAPKSTLELSLSVNQKVQVYGYLKRRGSNEPVADATIRLTQFHGSGARNPNYRIVTTDKDGRYTAQLQPGKIEIALQKPVGGWAAVHAWEVQGERAAWGLPFEVPDQDAPVELPALELVRLSAIEGTLLDRNGEAVDAIWDVVGYVKDSAIRCGTGTTQDGGLFILQCPETHLPVRYAAQRHRSSPPTNSHTVPSYDLKIISRAPLVLQFPGPARHPSLIKVDKSDRTDQLPALSTEELNEERKKRRADNDRAAAKGLAGSWDLTLPAGFVYPTTLSQSDDGLLTLDTEQPIVFRGDFAFQDDRLEMVETRRSDVVDFVWRRQEDGSFKLIHEQHHHGANYLGAVLKKRDARPAGEAATRQKNPQPRKDFPEPEGARLTDHAAAQKLVGRWMLTLPSQIVLAAEISQSGDGRLTLATSKKSDLSGRYVLEGDRLKMIGLKPGDQGFIWEVQNQNRLELIEGSRRSGVNYKGARLERLAIATLDEAAAAQKLLFQIPATVVNQARDLAEQWRRHAGDLKRRRPRGLSDLDSPELIRVAADRAIADLADAALKDDALARLRYLGNGALDALIAGSGSENPQVAKWCCVTLQSQGSKAVTALSRATTVYPDAAVRAAAASALGQTFDPAGVPALIQALEDPDPGVRVAAMNAIKYPRDSRAIEPLSRLVDSPGTGHVARQSMEHILKDQGYASWPVEMLSLRQLCEDAPTLQGESFGDGEIERLVQGLTSSNAGIVSSCLFALGQLDARKAVPEIIQAPESQMKYHVLAMLATNEAVDAIIQQLKSSRTSIREAAILGLADGADRWGAPLLVALLDDPALKVAKIDDQKGIPGSQDAFVQPWPEWHRAHAALFQFFSRFGLPGTGVNLVNGQPNNVSEEMNRLKAWWTAHGSDFLAGKPVPNPNLTTVFAFH